MKLLARIVELLEEVVDLLRAGARQPAPLTRETLLTEAAALRHLQLGERDGKGFLRGKVDRLRIPCSGPERLRYRWGDILDALELYGDPTTRALEDHAKAKDAAGRTPFRKAELPSQRRQRRGR